MFAALKGINMKHVVYMSAEAWDDVPSTTLLKSWNKLLRRTEEIAQETDDLESSTTELQPLLTKLGCDTSEEEVRRWLSGSDDVSCELLSEEDILQQLLYHK